MKSIDASPFDYRAAFIGPQGENADEMERLVLEVLRDHVMWRRNFHPEDQRLVGEWARTERPFRETTAKLRDELYAVLARLKRGTPLHSPRQLGHMVSDPTLPALVGYFAGLLYNQNNVVQEAAPETVRCERDYMAALARMVGYPTLVGETVSPDQERPRSFGHLSSGGTSANMEVLWVARNVRYFPLALRLWLAESGASDPLDLANLSLSCRSGERGVLGDASTNHLMDLPISGIVDIKERVARRMTEIHPETSKAIRAALPTVRQIGLGAFLERYHACFPVDRLSDPVVLISTAAHYCWKKAMDLTGLGSARLIPIDVDPQIRLDPDALEDKLALCKHDDTPVLMVVSIAGTTETASVDPVGTVNVLRDDPSSPAFWHHCDAAFGGYLASVVERRDGVVTPWEDLNAGHPGRAAKPDVYQALAAIEQTDSVVLDPHKLGFVPYPGGAVLYRDYPVRDAIAFDAPYLTGGEEAGVGGFLGRWTLEGSRPGAAAVSGYLTQTVIPLTPDGHGVLAANALKAHRELYDALSAHSGTGGIRFVSFNGLPDTLGTCFLVIPYHFDGDLGALNALTHRVWERFNVDEHGWSTSRNDYLLSKSEVTLEAYPQVVRDLLPEMHAERGPLELLRLVSLSPFLHELTGPDAAAAGFADRLASRVFEVARVEADAIYSPTEGTPWNGLVTAVGPPQEEI
jgi:glutamate/tyrosine decarboxylase-like PLP-dependent enzyme